MANIADRYQVDQTVAGQSVEEWRSFTNDKNFTYVPDQQNGSYSNQVSFDLTSVVSSGSWLSLQESYALLPFTTTITCAAAQTNVIDSKMVALKDSFLNFVDSIQFFVNGQQLIDQTTFSNMPLQIIDKLTMSQDDLKMKGSSLSIAPDTTTSIRQGNVAASSGDGITNNVFSYGSTQIDPIASNAGLAQRALNTFLTPGASGLPTAFASTSNAAAILAPYFSASSDKLSGTWSYVVYLPLSRLGDLLTKYPLVKGSQIRLVLNFNAGSSAINISANTPANYKMTANPTMTAGNTMPVMLTDSRVGMNNALGVASNATVTTKIQTTTTALTSSVPASGFSALPNCRVYCPTYKINPTFEERILSNRVQKIRYMDWYQQPIIGVTSGASFSQTLTTALPNVQYLLMVPFQNGSTAASLFATATCSQFQSPFDTAPATSLPGGMLAFQNFNVSVSGQNIYNQNQNYTFDNWVQEVQRVSLNGGLSKELSSGLVGLTEWNWSPFVVTDLSRRDESSDKTYQSVTVSGQNNTGVKVDYYCFIGFQKQIEIDVLTGAVKKDF